jgi:hypothetical protein
LLVQTYSESKNLICFIFGVGCISSYSYLQNMERFLYVTYYNSVAFVRERTIPTEQPSLVGEVSANFSLQYTYTFTVYSNFVILIIGFCILLRVILIVNNNTFCFATIYKVFY